MRRGLDTVLTPTQAAHVTSAAFRRNPLLNHHHVAVVVSCKTGNVLASATNEATAYGSVHAEVAALGQFERRLHDRTLHYREVRRGVAVLSLRVTVAGRLRLAKPCAACAGALRRCPHVRLVAWSDDEGDLVYERPCDQFFCHDRG